MSKPPFGFEIYYHDGKGNKIMVEDMQMFDTLISLMERDARNAAEDAEFSEITEVCDSGEDTPTEEEQMSLFDRLSEEREDSEASGEATGAAS